MNDGNYNIITLNSLSLSPPPPPPLSEGISVPSDTFFLSNSCSCQLLAAQLACDLVLYYSGQDITILGLL